MTKRIRVGVGAMATEMARWEGVLQACCSGSKLHSRVTASLCYSPATGALLVMPSEALPCNSFSSQCMLFCSVFTQRFMIFCFGIPHSVQALKISHLPCSRECVGIQSPGLLATFCGRVCYARSECQGNSSTKSEFWQCA